MTCGVSLDIPSDPNPILPCSPNHTTYRRTIDVHKYCHGIDISCGASDALYRVLARVVPEHSIVCPQEEVPSDPSRLNRPAEELLNPDFMPPYVVQLKVRKGP